MKKLIILLLIICFTAGVADATIRKGPYLIYPGVNTEMMVLWQLTGTQTCTLEWGEDTSYSTGSVQTTEYGNDHQHDYIITNLTPGTKYYYQVIEDVNHTGTFYAAPADTATAVKFFAIGDTRTTDLMYDAVNTRMIETYEADPAYQTFTMLTGDWVVEGELESWWDDEHFSRDHPNALESQANLPINGCIGNHEWDAAKGTLYDKYYPYPYPYGADDANLYWSFDYGPAHIVVIDQEAALLYEPNAAQLSWLKNDLATTTKEWVFIQLHAPAYSARGGHADDWDVREWIQPLCEIYEVDMVVAGHNHYYARCIKNNITHITAGHGGTSLATPNPNYSPYVVGSSCDKNNGYCKIAINGSSLNFEAVRVDGSVVESFTLSHPYPTELPFSDGFEDTNDYDSGDIGDSWDISDARYTVLQSDANSGNQACRTVKTNWVQRAISTKGYSNIKVEYARKTVGMDTGEYLFVEWSADNETWNNLESTQDTVWTPASFTCGSGANEKPGFRVRFRTNGNRNTEYGYVDDVKISGTPSGPPDTDPPSPDPMTWATVPYATSSSSIAMVATTATDPSGVEYFFDCITAGGHDSVWQPETDYTDTELDPNTTYTYQVKARDKSPNQNETGFSTIESATTESGPPTVYVYDIGMAYYAPKAEYYAAKATVWIKDTGLTDIVGATVYGDWSGDVSGSSEGDTGEGGKVTLESKALKGGGLYIFTVTDVSATGYTYDSSLNNETSDSITAP